MTPRAQQRSDSGFSPYLQLAEVLGFLEEELTALGARTAVLFTDVENIAVERLRRKQGARTGTSLVFRREAGSYHFACDTWLALEHNIYALHLALRNLRGVAKWGVGRMDQLLLGFAAGAKAAEAMENTPSRNGAMEEWMQELGLGPTATLEDATAVYHRRARQLVNDTQGMARLNAVMDEARKKLSNRSS